MVQSSELNNFPESAKYCILVRRGFLCTPGFPSGSASAPALRKLGVHLASFLWCHFAAGLQLEIVRIREVETFPNWMFLRVNVICSFLPPFLSKALRKTFFTSGSTSNTCVQKGEGIDRSVTNTHLGRELVLGWRGLEFTETLVALDLIITVATL